MKIHFPLKKTVQTAPDNNRPEIFAHHHQMNNQFVQDYFEGITREEAERRIHAAFATHIC